MFAKTSEKLVLAGLIAVVAVAGSIAVLGGSRPGGQKPPSEGLSPPAAGQPQLPQLPRMVIQQRFAGPFAGTEIDRWRDPLDGTVCYIYFPTIVHRTPAPSGYFDYGSNSIGSISCLPGPAAPPVTAQIPSGAGQAAPR